MSLARLVIPAAGLLAACGDTTVVRIVATDTSMVAARVDGGGWVDVAQGASVELALDVESHYEIVTVCTLQNSPVVVTRFGAPGDADDAWEITCPGLPPLVRVDVDGSGRSPTRAYIGAGTPSVDENGPRVATPAGTYDVVAYFDDPERPGIAIRRGVEIAGDTTITFDDDEIHDLVLRDVSFEGILDAPPRATFATRDGTYAYSPLFTSDALQMWTIPAAVMEDGDVHQVRATGPGGTWALTLTRSITDGDVTFEMPSPPAGGAFVEVDPVAMTWSDDRAWSEVRLELYGTGAGAPIWRIIGFEHWAAGQTALSVTPDAAPGWDDAWDLALAGDWYASFTERDDDGSLRASTSGAFAR